MWAFGKVRYPELLLPFLRWCLVSVYACFGWDMSLMLMVACLTCLFLHAYLSSEGGRVEVDGGGAWTAWWRGWRRHALRPGSRRRRAPGSGMRTTDGGGSAMVSRLTEEWERAHGLKFYCAGPNVRGAPSTCVSLFLVLETRVPGAHLAFVEKWDVSHWSKSEMRSNQMCLLSSCQVQHNLDVY
jgi:hypothetical protein